MCCQCEPMGVRDYPHAQRCPGSVGRLVSGGGFRRSLTSQSYFRREHRSLSVRDGLGRRDRGIPIETAPPSVWIAPFLTSLHSLANVGRVVPLANPDTRPPEGGKASPTIAAARRPQSQRKKPKSWSWSWCTSCCRSSPPE
jgi:hypothetical protein